jgi:penicillin amidase
MLWLPLNETALSFVQMKRRNLAITLTALLASFASALHAAEALSARAQAAVAEIHGTMKVHGLFFAQGFVAAQDRLFQMELWKRAGQGRLAEILGPTAVERDAQARRLRYRGDLKAEYASYAPDTLPILRAFTDGINAYIKVIQAPGGRGLPVEFKVVGFTPEPWQPVDCLNRLAAYSMMSNASSELRMRNSSRCCVPRKRLRWLPLSPTHN